MANNLRSRRIVALERTASTSALVATEQLILSDGRIMQNHGGLILPLPMDEAEWSAAAAKQQAELISAQNVRT